MPNLVICAKKTPFSGDDLRFFCICACLFRILQLVLGISLVACASIQEEHVTTVNGNLTLECELDGDFSRFANNGVAVLYSQGAVSICLAILGLGTAIPTILISMKGTPTDSEPRKALLALCYCNISVMNVFRITGFVLAVFATSILQDYCACLEGGMIPSGNTRLREACPDSNTLFTLMVALIVTHTMDVIVAMIELLFFLCPCKAFPALVPSESKWKVFLVCFIGCSSTLTCCLFGGMEALQGDFGDLALVMSNYTNNNQTLDVTVSDVAAGLIMVLRRQRETLLEARELVHKSFYESNEEDELHPKEPPQPRRFSDPSQSKTNERRNRTLKRMASTPEMQGYQATIGISDSEIEISTRDILLKEHYQEKFFIAEAARFMPLAQSMYTWMIYLVEHRLLGVVRLGYLILRRCACFCPSPRDKLRYDFPWEPHMIALQELSGLHAEDIIFASFKQSIVALPYMISVDNEWRSIVIAIRGTLSMESVLADMAIRPEELSAIGEKHGFDGEGKYCHRGILKSSEWIYADLMKHGKLKEALDGKYKNYRLVVVGHSLGGGCAAMLSLLLRPTHPNLRCLAFGVPGSVFSENLAEECSSWLTSFVLDADVIPRLAIHQFEVLRNSVLDMICRIKVSKYQVFSLEKSSTKSRDELAEERKRTMYDVDEIPDSECKCRLDDFLGFQAELKHKNETTEHYIDLFPPGKIIQFFRTRDPAGITLTRTAPGRDANNSQQNPTFYVARWIQRKDLRNIILSSHMLNDHVPGNMSRKIQKVAETIFDLKPPTYKVFQDIEA